MTLGKSFHPPLVAAFPVLCLFSANLDLIPIAHLWRPLGLALAMGMGLWILASLAWRNTDKGAVTASLMSLAVFAFAATAKAAMRYDGPVMQVSAWAFFAVLIATLAAWKCKWVGPLNVLASGCVLAAASQITLGVVNAGRPHGSVGPKFAASSLAPKDKPDVINIILDGYGRSDQLKRAIGFKNDAFIEGLKSRGFYVADDAHSNYCQTELSIASSLNMDFVQTLLPKTSLKSSDRSPLTELLWNNAAARRLRTEGYRFVSITTGFPPVRFLNTDLQLHDNEGITWFESAVLQMTPIGAIPGASQSMLVERRRHLLDAFKNLQDLSARTTNPRFVVAHILAPHPPFVFNADGSARKSKGPFGFWDGSDYLTYIGNADMYRQGYAGQAEYIDKLVLETIDKLIATKGPKPIIVIQGDHGSKVGLDQNSLERTDLPECFSNLAAFYVPDSVRARLYPEITPVNYFRVIFSALFNDPLPQLPDTSWYSTYPLPYDFTDVTNRLGNAPTTVR